MVNLIKIDHKVIRNTQPLFGKLRLLHNWELMEDLDAYDDDDESERAPPWKQKWATLFSMVESKGKECGGGSQLSNTDRDMP